MELEKSISEPQPTHWDRLDWIITPDESVLVTGAAGFIGPRVIQSLLDLGCKKIRCLARSTNSAKKISNLFSAHLEAGSIEVIEGNLLSREDCEKITPGVSVIYHLAAGRGQKAFSDAFSASVVTTRNLLDAARVEKTLKRFVNVSSFTVYSNRANGSGALLDESCPIEDQPHLRGDAYTFAKTKQDELVRDYGERFDIPYVIVRPGFVYGPGNETISGRVGIRTFGFFLHLGGGNTIPFTYVDNCADAIALAGLKRDARGRILNIVDDDLPSSREFLKLYKRNVVNFRSVYFPHALSYLMCLLWEKYSEWSEGQLPPVFNRRVWHAYWKKASYSNALAKQCLAWSPRIPAREAFGRYFESCKQALHA